MLEALRETGWTQLLALPATTTALLIGYLETADLAAAQAGMAATESTPAGRPRWPASSRTSTDARPTRASSVLDEVFHLDAQLDRPA